MTKEQIENVVNGVNFHENGLGNHKVYTETDIKYDKPVKPIPCYVITDNYSNPSRPYVYYGEYDGKNFLSYHVINPNIIPREEYNVLGYIEY